MNISTVRQQSGKYAFATIVEDMFSVEPLRDYISSSVVNKKSVMEREEEWSETSAVKEEGFG
jgi:hypothetical protein